jgi:hypothetical protein
MGSWPDLQGNPASRGQAQPTGSARETTFRSQRPLHQVPLTSSPRPTAIRYRVPATSTLGRTDASKEFTLSQSSCAVALFGVRASPEPQLPTTSVGSTPRAAWCFGWRRSPRGVNRCSVLTGARPLSPRMLSRRRLVPPGSRPLRSRLKLARGADAGDERSRAPERSAGRDVSPTKRE